MLSDFGRGIGTKVYASPTTNERKTNMELNDAIVDYEEAHSVRIDYAKPQGWFNDVLAAKVNIDPQDYVWVYDMKGGVFGKPLHKDTIMADYYVRKEATWNT
tara:strand:- start:762 stop:1067 length:306 start_codon:yes stop_codon:yes gene_type:complete